jgi:hypothetical protein
MTGNASRLFAAIAALALMLVAANRFLSYLWWTACYSAWRGIPKMAEQWRAAGTHASLNGWSFIFFEIASIALLCTAMRLRYGLRILASLIITVAATAVFALALSWFKQGIH